MYDQFLRVINSIKTGSTEQKMQKTLIMKNYLL
jgi:hypothetical protein